MHEIRVPTVNRTFKKLSLHCSDLSKLMFELGFFSGPAEWLNVASGVDKVECFTGRFNDCMMCSAADEYDDKRDQLLSSILTELTRFLFIWNALEVLIDELIQIKLISRNAKKKMGKINAACKMIKMREIEATTIPNHGNMLRCLKCLIAKSDNFSDVYKGTLYNEEWLNEAGEGLYWVYKIRNKFAHGSHTFPEPEDWSEEKPLDKNVIQRSSQMVLISMQMLLMAYYTDQDCIVNCRWDHSISYSETGLRELEVKAYLKQMHMEGELEGGYEGELSGECEGELNGELEGESDLGLY